MPLSIGRMGYIAPRLPVGVQAPARFERAAKIASHTPEASDVVALPGGKFLVVGDRSDKVRVVKPDGSVQKVKLEGLPNGNSQLEGVTYDPVRHHVFVVREESHELLRYEWNPEKNKAPKLEKRFDLKRQADRNKGVEGLAYVPSHQSPTGKPQLLLAQEGNPRELLLLDDGGSGKPKKVKLEAQVWTSLHDFSAVAVDPKTGHVFLSSDESSTLAEIKLVRQGDHVEGQLVQIVPLRNRRGEPLKRVEGLSFNSRGDLFVLTENDGDLLQLKRL